MTADATGTGPARAGALSGAAGSTAVLLTGAVLVRIVLTGDYLRYVRSGMGPWLLLSGAVLVVLGLTGLVGALRGGPAAAHGDHGHGHDHGHDHAGGDRIGWLLVAPVLALFLVTPPALGSSAVDRTWSGRVSVTSHGAVFAPLPASAVPRPMTLLEFGERALDRGGASLAGAPVQLTGFVARPADGAGTLLARYQIACCAADAQATVVRVTGLPAAPARDSWLAVTGTFTGLGADGVPELLVTGSRPIPPPEDPYEV